MNGDDFDPVPEPGGRVGARMCTCSVCRNSWFVRQSSDEFLPKFCCYCGLQFIGWEKRDFPPVEQK